MKDLSYKGHTLRVEYDAEDGIYFGAIAGVRVHAETVGKLEIAFHRVVDDGLATDGGAGPAEG